MDFRERIDKAHADGTILKAFREDIADDEYTCGYVVAMGADYFAVEVIDSDIKYNGFNCLRYEDLTEVEAPPEYAEFYQKAIALRGLSRTPIGDVDLSSVESLLRTAGSLHPVVTIHTEETDVDVCFIGKVADIQDGELELIEVTPNGEWETEPEHYELDEITRVDFAGQYEDALVLVARSREC